MAFGSRGGDDRQQSRRGRVEYVQFGSPRRRPPRWLSRLLLACLVGVAVVIVAGRSIHRHAPAPSAQPALPPVEVTKIGHELLGVKAGWQLFGLDQDGIVAIQFARGRITRTALPPSLGSGPVSFIVGPRAAIVRPLDNVPGYLIPDGEQARPLTGILARGGLLLPGPTPGQEWDTAGGTNSLVLVGPDEHPTGTRITLPNPGWPSQSAMSDGRGDILVASDAGS